MSRGEKVQHAGAVEVARARCKSQASGIRESPGPPPGLNYAVVEKRRATGQVVEILARVVSGTMATVLAAPGQSSVSRWINVSFLELRLPRTGTATLGSFGKACTFVKGRR